MSRARPADGRTFPSDLRAVLRTAGARLAVLALVHFVVDFYAAVTVPLPEPTLVEHLDVDLASVALLLGGCALLVNVVQPLSGWLLPRRGLPLLLVAGPLAAALTACIGCTTSYSTVALMLIVAAAGIGMVHPEAALAAHGLARSRKGLAISVFMSGGYIGFAAGSLCGGLWVEFRDQGLAHFWLLALPALAVAGLVLLAGLHRLEGQAEEQAREAERRVPFGPVLGGAVAIAVAYCLLVRFVTIFLVRSFPGEDAQGWGGTTVFTGGVFVVLGAFVWGHASDRIGRGRVLALTPWLCAPCLYGMLHVGSVRMAPVWMAGIGFTLGATFPLTVVLARQARGLSERLRLGLVIGGAWGLGEIAFMLGGKWVALQPPGSVAPVVDVLNLCWLCLAIMVLVGLWLTRREGRPRAHERGAEERGLP